MKAYITSGHHNNDPGAVTDKYKESAVNIEVKELVSLRVSQIDSNIEIWNDDNKDTLSKVISKINKDVSSDDLLIEIHFDSSVGSASGTTALVANNARGKSIDLATTLSNAVSSVLEIPNRGCKTESQSNRGKLGILHTKASSVLLEICFLSNSDDMKKYEENKHWICEEIAIAIVNFFNK